AADPGAQAAIRALFQEVAQRRTAAADQHRHREACHPAIIADPRVEDRGSGKTFQGAARPGAYRLMRLLAILVLGAALLFSRPALAVTADEIPADLKARLPDFLWKNIEAIDPRALEFLTVADLNEFACAYEGGTLRFVDQVEICECGGPLTPELAELVL